MADMRGRRRALPLSILYFAALALFSYAAMRLYPVLSAVFLIAAGAVDGRDAEG
jgi:hypothetical protein